MLVWNLLFETSLSGTIYVAHSVSGLCGPILAESPPFSKFFICIHDDLRLRIDDVGIRQCLRHIPFRTGFCVTCSARGFVSGVP